MAVLRAVVESLGHADVQTYLQSGNVVFTPARGTRRDLGPALARALREETGLDVPVLVRSGRELAKLVDANPYPVDDPTKVVVAFLGEAIAPSQLGLGDLEAYAPDELTRVGRELVISLPAGQARSKLMETLTKRRQPTVVTVRNWRTVAALAELTAAG
jgi:uncharacterized protein (DUF1697 family)